MDFLSTLEERNSPVIWGSSSSNENWISSYSKNGFYTHKSIGPKLDLKFDIEKLFSTPRIGRIFETDEVTTRSQFNIHNDYPELISEVLTEKLYTQAKCILGSEPVIYQSHVNFKVQKVGGAYDWHSDYTYWKSHDGMLEPRAISVIIPFDEHLPTNGALNLIKGSHYYYYPHDLTTKKIWNNERIRHDPTEKEKETGLVPESLLNEISRDKIHTLNMQAGDYTIMDANTWHASAANESSKNRSTLFLILTSEDTNFDSNLLNYRPGHITCRKKIPLKNFKRF